MITYLLILVSLTSTTVVPDRYPDREACDLTGKVIMSTPGVNNLNIVCVPKYKDD